MHEIAHVLRTYKVTQGMTPQKAVQILEALGPTYVKIGQMASTRSDMLPKEYCEAFERLHADVSPLSYEEVLACIDQAYGASWDTVFLAIDPTPLGSASIAQVHKAVLLDGSVVAVKVRRPHIVEEMAEDITMMRHLLATAEFVTTEHENVLLNFENLLDELERTTDNELDFNIELNNLIRFHAEIAREQGVTSPIPYPKVSNASVLVMEYVEGVQVDDVTALEAHGARPEKIAFRITQSYISQVLESGFFHADPHPGNILVNGNEIIWIDLGMTGSLSASERELVGRMFDAVFTNNAYELMQAVISISKVKGPLSTGILLQKLSILLNKYATAELDDLDLGEILGEVVEIMREQNLIMSSSVTMLVRGLVTLEGVIQKLAPSLNILQVVRVYVMKHALDPKHIESEVVKLMGEGKSSVEALAKIPAQMSNTIDMLNKGEISIKGDISVPENMLATIYASVGRLSLALISVGLFLGSSLLCTTDMEPRFLEVPVLGVLGYIGAFILGVYVIVQTFRSRHQMKNHQKLD